MATLVVLVRDNFYTGGPDGRGLAKKPKPGDLSVLGLRLSNHFTRRDRCQHFIQAARPGLRVIDSLPVTAKHNVTTPVNWHQDEDVIIAVTAPSCKPGGMSGYGLAVGLVT
jgi:hypothetical protein